MIQDKIYKNINKKEYKEPKKIPIIDEEEYINCPKCGKNFKTWHANVKFVPDNDYSGYAHMNIFCPRCKYITKRRPLGWSVKE